MSTYDTLNYNNDILFLNQNSDHKFSKSKHFYHYFNYYKCDNCGVVIGLNNKDNTIIQTELLTYIVYKKEEIKINLEKCDNVIIKNIII